MVDGDVLDWVASLRVSAKLWLYISKPFLTAVIYKGIKSAPEFAQNPNEDRQSLTIAFPGMQTYLSYVLSSVYI